MNYQTTIERISDRELVATRTVGGPARLVFEAWTKPELIMRWWAPASFGISFLSCETDVRTGGSYRYVFGHRASDQPMAFFGRYVDVTTATFEESDGRTRVIVHDLFPSKAVLDEAIASGSAGAWPEQFDALDALFANLGEK